MFCLEIVLALALIYIFHFYYKRWSLPPGPPSLPIIGSIPFISSIGPSGFLDISLADKYGKICRVDLINESFFVINDFELAKNLFNREDMSGRPVFFFNKYVLGYDGVHYGLISTDGPFWQSQRRFSLMKLKNLGFGRKALESAIYEEVQYLFDIFEQEKDASGDILVKELFNAPIINVIWQIIASTRCDYNNAKDKEIIEGINVLLQTKYDIRYSVSALYHILPHDKADKATINFKKIVEDLIDEHEENLNENMPHDFIDYYLIEMRSTTDPFFSKKQLITVCVDLFFAGSETTSTTLTWMLLFMAVHEDVQEKCYSEILRVIGSANPREEDMISLPYCLATINEVQRMGNVAPGSLIHLNTKDIVIEGYKIPKGSQFIANFRKFHSDPKVFSNPETFNPDRFYKKKVEAQFVPFGIGKRVCMGMSMAKKELYYFTVMILQMYKIKKSSVHEAPDPNNYEFATTASPNPFYINLAKRSALN